MNVTTAYYGGPGTEAQNKIVGDLVNAIVVGDGGNHVDDYLSMGVHVDGSLVGGTLYHNWYSAHGVVELTSASLDPRWLTRPVIRAMFFLPFQLLDCQACVLRVRSDNARMIKIARKFGFDEHVIPRLFGRDVDMHVFVMTDDAWRAHRVNRHG